MKAVVFQVTACFALLLLLSFGPTVIEAGPPEVKHVGPAKAMQMLKQNLDTILLDVRTPGEYRQGHLANSRLIPLDQLEKLAASLLPDLKAPMIVYCHSGRRSSYASRMLREMGYTKVTNMTGGIAAWQSQGLPVVRE